MTKSYNQRLFGNPFRKLIHNGRFYWLRKVIKKYFPNYNTVIELGCHDARSLIFLPYPPTEYIGLDADWEGGLQKASDFYKEIEEYKFFKIEKVNEFPEFKKKFDLVICLETLEHLPDNDLEEYVLKLYSLMNNYLFISIPNEIGFIFILKFFIKRVFNMQPDDYTFMEIVNQYLGRVNKVNRDNHKGFSWVKIVKILKRDFQIISMEGIPFSLLPLSLNIGIGIVLKKKDINIF